MKRLFIGLFALLCTAQTVFAQEVKLKKIAVTEQIGIALPETFRAMTDNEVVAEYTVYRKPLAMYRDDRDPVHLGINMSASRWENKDMVILKSFYKATLLDLYSDIDFIQEELVTQGDYQYAVFEFTSVVRQNDNEESIVASSPIRRYTYIQYTVVNGNVMVFNFSSPMMLQMKWAPVAKAMMATIDLKGI